ncbi:MAG: glycosyltransferase family 39 protein [Bacteroidales bacterium]|nr:glycosyltransferase family 39 protein [Bacteroidales bacterium]
MKRQITELWENKPIKLIIWLAIITRLVAAIFSKGFGMHDDHFLVIEAAQSWVDGFDYNNWLPGSQSEAVPSGHSFFYVGIHYLVLLCMKVGGIFNPQTKMFIIRLLHGAFSLITVYYGYKITEKLSDKKTARITGLLLAVYWFMPFVSVRNLVEVVCIPFLVYSVWIIINHWDEKKSLKYYLLSGFIIGLAFSVRFQTIIFAFGIGSALLIKLKWKEAFLYGLSFLFSIVLIQGGIDYFIWGRPFAELGEYVGYNIENAETYITGSWYNYILVILGFLIPPVSFFLFFGFFRTWKRHLLIFLPTLIFLLFHSIFPNKQERFILPIIPFVILLGMIGWQDFLQKSSLFNNKKKFLKAAWIFFWIINLLLLPVVSTTYSKKARVESMIYLSKYDNIKNLLLEDSNYGNAKMCPLFYLGEWVKEFYITNENSADELSEVIKNNPEYQPRFILFFEDKNLEQRVKDVQAVFPEIVYETSVEPGFIDKVMHWLNPLNANQTIYIYKNRGVTYIIHGEDER